MPLPTTVLFVVRAVAMAMVNGGNGNANSSQLGRQR